MSAPITIEIKVLTAQAGTNVRALAKNTDALKTSVDRATKATDAQGKQQQESSKKTDEQSASTRRNARRQDDLGTRLRRLRDVYTRIIESKGELNQVDVKRAKRIKAEIDATEKQVSANKRAAGDNETAFTRMRNSATSALGPAGLIGLSAAAGVAVVKGVSRAIRVGREYEQQLADLEAITGIAGDRQKYLSDRALEASIKYGEAASNIITANKLVASQLAEKIDFGTDEGARQLADIAEKSIILQKAAGVDLATAVGTLTTAINQFNLSADETDRLINSIAAGSKFGAAEVGEQAEAYAQAGSVAAGANLKFEELNAGVQVLAANAIKGSQAGNNIKGVLLTLQNPAKLAAAGIKDANLQTDGFAQTLEKLKPLLEDSVELEKLFGRENVAAARILIANAESVATMTEKVTGGNVALEQAAVQMNTFNGAQSRLSSAIDSQLIGAFEEAGGVMVQSMNLLAEWVVMTGHAVHVINEFFDANSKLRGELEEGSLFVEKSVESYNKLRLELAEAATQTGLTAEENNKLRESYERINGALKARASDQYDANVQSKARKKAIEEEIDILERNASALADYIPGIFASNKDLVASLKVELEALNLKIVTGEKSYKKWFNALQEGTISFEEFIKNITSNQADKKLSVLIAKFGELATMPDPTAETIQQMAALQAQIEALGGSVDDLIPKEETLSGKLAELGKELTDLLDSSEDVTDETWKRAEAISAEMKAIQGSQQQRKEYLEYLEKQASGKSMTAIEQTVDVVLPDEIPDLSMSFDADPILVASDAIRALNQDIADYVATSEILGNHSNDITYAIQRTEQAIADLVANGYTAQDAVMQDLIEQNKALIAIEETKSALTKTLNDESIKSMKDVGNAMREEVLSGIKARLAEAISTQIAKILSTVPFPFNIALAAGAGAAVSALFNQIPKFNTGGEVPGNPSETTDTVHAMLTPQEFVVSKKSALQAPHALKAMNEDPGTAKQVERFVLEGKSAKAQTNLAQAGLRYATQSDKAVGYNSGGFVGSNKIASARIVDSVIAREVTQRETMAVVPVNNNEDLVAEIRNQTEVLKRVKSEATLNISMFEEARADWLRLQRDLGRK